jgi:hypothetical protein
MVISSAMAASFQHRLVVWRLSLSLPDRAFQECPRGANKTARIVCAVLTRNQPYTQRTTKKEKEQRVSKAHEMMVHEFAA